jgi:hypothetical protein
MLTTVFSALYADPLYLREGSYIYPYYGQTCLATFRERPDGKVSITQGFGGAYGFLYDPDTGRVHVGNERGETIFRVNDSQTRVCHGIGGYDDHLMVNSPDGAALASAAIASMGDDRLITPSTAPRSAHELMGDHHPGLADSVDSGNPDYLGYNSSVDPMNRYNDRSKRREWSDDPAENLRQGQRPISDHSWVGNDNLEPDFQPVSETDSETDIDDLIRLYEVKKVTYYGGCVWNDQGYIQNDEYTEQQYIDAKKRSDDKHIREKNKQRNTVAKMKANEVRETSGRCTESIFAIGGLIISLILFFVCVSSVAYVGALACLVSLLFCVFWIIFVWPGWPVMSAHFNGG